LPFPADRGVLCAGTEKVEGEGYISNTTPWSVWETIKKSIAVRAQ